MFTRDHRTGLMKELAPGEPNHFALASDRPSPSHFRVLVADDDETDCRLTIRHLGKAWPVERDLTVECAGDGVEALEKIRSHRFALVVMDWNMPELDGAAVLRTIREIGLHIPVVVASAQRREAIAGELNSMAAGFVNKNEMDATSFRNAIVASILLQAGVFGLLRSGGLDRILA